MSLLTSFKMTVSEAGMSRQKPNTYEEECHGGWSHLLVLIDLLLLTAPM